MNEYIYQNKNSLSQELCDDIINRFDNEDNKYDGVTYSGINKNTKDTNDFIIPDNNEWNEINNILSDELYKNLKLYINYLNDKDNFKEDKNYGNIYKVLSNEVHLVNNFMIQKYKRNIGKYIYHEDGSIENKQYRIITYLWYLNDIDEGGETEFFGGSFKVKPEIGKIIFFPAFWCFPHRGNIPISNDKYIITGWLYKKMEPKIMRIPTIIPLKNTINNNLIINYYKQYIITKYLKEYVINKKILINVFNNILSLTMCNYIITELNKYLDDENILLNIDEKTKNNYINIKNIEKIYNLLIFSFDMISNQIKYILNINNNIYINIKNIYLVKYNNNEIIDLSNNELLILNISLNKNNKYIYNDEYIYINEGDCIMFNDITKLKINNLNYVLVYYLDICADYIDENGEQTINIYDLVKDNLDKII